MLALGERTAGSLCIITHWLAYARPTLIAGHVINAQWAWLLVLMLTAVLICLCNGLLLLVGVLHPVLVKQLLVIYTHNSNAPELLAMKHLVPRTNLGSIRYKH